MGSIVAVAVLAALDSMHARRHYLDVCVVRHEQVVHAQCGKVRDWAHSYVSVESGDAHGNLLWPMGDALIIGHTGTFSWTRPRNV